MEPGYYECKACGHRWERMEFKMRANPPRECPSCKAGPEQQVTDRAKEDQYVRDVYGPVVSVITGGKGS